MQHHLVMIFAIVKHRCKIVWNALRKKVKLKRLNLLKKNQANGELKAPAIGMDIKDFGIGSQILHDLHISKIKLMTNTQQTRRVGMIGYGLEIVDYVTY